MVNQDIQMFSAITNTIVRCPRGDDPAEYAQRHYRHAAPFFEKAAATSDAYAEMTDISSWGLGVLRSSPRSVIDQMIPFASLAPVRMPILIGAQATAGLIPEHAPMPVLGSVSRKVLEYVKTGAITLFDGEIVQSGAPEAESHITKTLISTATNCSNQGLIETLLDSNAVPIASSGNFFTDTVAAVNSLEISESSMFFLLVSPKVAMKLSLLTASGQLVFPGLGIGGDVNPSLRVIPVNEEILDIDSSGTTAILIDASGLLLNAGELFIQRSKDVTLEMSTTPGVPGTTDLISTFQTDTVAIKVARRFAVEPFRSSVAWIQDAEWN